MTYINNVATNGGYTIVRLHPQYMDQAGYITRAQWQGVLDQIKALTDAGTVEVMTLRDASVTTPSTALAGHTHGGLSRNHDSAQIRLDSAGQAQQLSPAGDLVWQVGTNGQLTHGTVPFSRTTGTAAASHQHTRLDTATAALVLDSSGGVQHHVDGARKFRLDNSGTVLEGTVPVERVPGLADALYDSGERNLTALVTGADGGALYVSRTGLWVTVDLEGLSPATDGHWTIYTLPLGFRPRRPQIEYFPTYWGPLREASIYADGRIHVWNAEADDTYRGGFRYRTADPIPTTLPGIPA